MTIRLDLKKCQRKNLRLTHITLQVILIFPLKPAWQESGLLYYN